MQSMNTHNLDLPLPPLFFFKEGSEFQWGRGESEKLKKWGESLVWGQVFKKKEAGTFAI